MAEGATEEPSFLSATTIAALSTLISIIAAAYAASLRLLPASTSSKWRFFFIWHAADGLVHLILEASYIYNCFFTYKSLPAPTTDYPHPAALLATANNFLGRSDRVYGSFYGNNVFAKLWQDYAQADKRWGGADPTVISLELLTVLIDGPLAIYVCDLIRKGAGAAGSGRLSGKLFYWGSILAVAELYGGFMTFCPEWLTGSLNLDTSSFMKLYVSSRPGLPTYANITQLGVPCVFQHGLGVHTALVPL